MSGFSRNWMTRWCWAVGLFGVILAGGGLEATSDPTRIVFGLWNGPGEFDLNPQMRFSLAVLGAVTIGWSLTLLAAIQATNQLGEQLGKPIWVLVTATVMSWYVIDSTPSVATSFGLNAVPNTVFTAAFLSRSFAAACSARTSMGRIDTRGVNRPARVASAPNQ